MNDSNNASIQDSANPFLAFISDQKDIRQTHMTDITTNDDNFISKSEGPLLYKVITTILQYRFIDDQSFHYILMRYIHIYRTTYSAKFVMGFLLSMQIYCLN
jgi:hypothetical protein